MKHVNKEQIIDQIKEYEEMEEIGDLLEQKPGVTIEKGSYEYYMAIKLRQENHRKDNKYSNVIVDLNEMHDIMKKCCEFIQESTSYIGPMTADEEYVRIVDKVKGMLANEF